MARKNNKPQAEEIKIQKVNKLEISDQEKAEMLKISKSLGEQTTFNTDPVSELVEDGEIENAI